MNPQELVQWRSELFPARLVDRLCANDVWLYAFREVFIDPAVGTYKDAEPGRYGILGESAAREILNRKIEITSTVYVWMRLRGHSSNGTPIYEFESPESGVAVVKITASSPDADGYYTAYLSRWIDSSLVWSETGSEVVLAKSANGEGLMQNQRYMAQFGDAKDGDKSIYIVDRINSVELLYIQSHSGGGLYVGQRESDGVICWVTDPNGDTLTTLKKYLAWHNGTYTSGGTTRQHYITALYKVPFKIQSPSGTFECQTLVVSTAGAGVSGSNALTMSHSGGSTTATLGLTLADADLSTRGLVNADPQLFAPDKSFALNLTVQSSGPSHLTLEPQLLTFSPDDGSDDLTAMGVVTGWAWAVSNISETGGVPVQSSLTFFRGICTAYVDQNTPHEALRSAFVADQFGISSLGNPVVYGQAGSSTHLGVSMTGGLVTDVSDTFVLDGGTF